jgi:tape measure domain-containing protein
LADNVERRIIEVLGRVEQSFARDLKAINTQLGEVQKNVKSIQSIGVGILGGIVGTETVQALVRVLDTQTALRRSLQATIPVGQDLVKTQEELLGISIRTQQSLEAVTRLYTRLSIAITDVNVNQSELTKVVEAFGNTMLIASTGVNEAAAAATQFGQALASGKLAGDEFRSLMENVPVLARVLAENLETANGQFGVTIGELRELSKAGELTTERVIEAVTRGFDDLQKRTKDLPRTIGSGVQALTDAFANLAGTIDRLFGISPGIGNFFAKIAEAINKNKDAIANLGPAIFGVLATTFAALLTQIPLVGAALASLATILGVTVPQLSLLIGALTLLGSTFGRLADQLNLFGAEDVTLDQALMLKDKDAIISSYVEVEAKLEELRDKQERILQFRERKLAQGATETGTDKQSEDLRQANKNLETVNQAMLEQQKVADALREGYEAIEGGVNSAAKAILAAAAAQEKFMAVSAESRTNVVNTRELILALGESKEKYDEVKRSQELGAKIAKDWATAQKEGIPAERRTELAAISAAEFELTKTLEERLKIDAELAKFRDLSDLSQQLADEKSLSEALRISNNEYERRKNLLKVQTQVRTDVQKVEALGGTVDPKERDEREKLALAILEESQSREKLEESIKAENAAREQGADLEKQIAQQIRLNDALNLSEQEHAKVQAAIEAENLVEQTRQRLIEAGVANIEAILGPLRAQALALGDVKLAGDAAADSMKAFNEANKLFVDVSQNVANLREQAEALKVNKDRFEDVTEAQEREIKLAEFRKTLEGDKRLSAAEIDARTIAYGYELENVDKLNKSNQKRIEILDKQKSAAESAAKEIASGRERLADSREELALEAQTLDKRIEALRISKEAGDQENVIAKARIQAQNLVNQLSEKDVGLRKKVYDQIYNEVLALEQKKKTIKDIEEEQEKQRKLAEQRVRFEEGPKATVEETLKSSQAQLEQAKIADEKQRRIVKDRYDDELQLIRIVEQQRKAGLDLSDAEIEDLQRKIELNSEIQRQLEKQLEANKAIEAIREEADPFKKLREERAVIEKGLATPGVFVTDDQRREAVERLGEIERAMSGVTRAANELQAMGNPYANLVEAAANLEFVTSQAFAKLVPTEKIEQGGVAALQVIGTISDTLKALGVENFQVQKGLAIAEATINAALAITKVLAQGGAFAIPLAASIGALAGAQIALIAAQEPPARALGGGVNPRQLYRVGEQGPEMYRSLSGKNYMIPGEGGNVTPNNRLGGLVINNNGPPITATDQGTDASGNRVVTIDAAVKAVRKDFENQMMNGYGSFPRSIRRNTQAGRRI